MALSPFSWPRGPRSQFSLGPEHGLYALFLRKGATLNGIAAANSGLLYIGLAANRQGLKGRCHFNATTRNHSPRKSLAVLLMGELTLEPILVVKPNARNTWGLTPGSEQQLTAWMHENLEVAIFPCPTPEPLETNLIGRFAPPLNLAKCAQTADHRRISAARSAVLAKLDAAGSPARPVKPPSVPPVAAPAISYGRKPAVASERSFANLDTAEKIAAHFDLNPKSYRQRLREGISWYQKPQLWTFSVGSPEWKDMIAIAERMAGRSL